MLPFGAQRRALTPAEGGSDLYRLFANGEDGFLFGNFGDLTRLFTTTSAPVQIANDGDPVGLAFEDSDWQRRTYAAQVAQAAELITNGGFDVDANWTKGASVTISGGVANLPLGSGYLEQGFATIAGATYRVRATAGARAVFCGAWDTAGNGTLLSGSASGRIGTFEFYFVANDTQSFVAFTATGAGDTTLDNVSVKQVAGNHGLQATTSARPFYKPNSGKPYLLFDGSDDRLLTSFLPTTALTVAVAVRIRQAAGVQSCPIGGGSSASNTRVRIDRLNTGGLTWAWGTNAGVEYGGNMTGQDAVALLTGESGACDFWLNGAQMISATPAGGPNGGGAITLGAYNNAGTPTTFFNDGIYAALALNRRVTPAEIALITSRFRSTYQ